MTRPDFSSISWISARRFGSTYHSVAMSLQLRISSSSVCVAVEADERRIGADHPAVERGAEHALADVLVEVAEASLVVAKRLPGAVPVQRQQREGEADQHRGKEGDGEGVSRIDVEAQDDVGKQEDPDQQRQADRRDRQQDDERDVTVRVRAVIAGFAESAQAAHAPRRRCAKRSVAQEMRAGARRIGIKAFRPELTGRCVKAEQARSGERCPLFCLTLGRKSQREP